MSSLADFLTLHLFAASRASDSRDLLTQPVPLTGEGATTIVMQVGEQIQVTRDQVWLTLPGDSRDHILQAGDRWTRPPAHPERALAVVIQSVGPQVAGIRRG